MSLIKPLAFNIKKGDLDTDGRTLQLLDTVHRSALMPIVRGKPPAGTGSFKNPALDLTYDGFDAQGDHYDNGGKGRVWYAQEVIDDFSDKVTDSVMWEAASGSPDFSEGGLDLTADPPFGKRCFATYGGPAAEQYDRKGKMIWSTGSSDKVVISGRCRVPVATVDVQLTNAILLGLQQAGSDADYVFAGVVNTATYSRQVVMGEVVAGVATVKAAVNIPGSQDAVDVAIEIDEFSSQYRGYYTFVLDGDDYTGTNWNPVGAAQPLPAGWPSSAKPRIHGSFPAAHTPGERHSLSDVRVEVESGEFAGEQRATWALEILDGTNPTELAGLNAFCPDELMALWCRDASGNMDLTLIDTTDPSDPKMWRRWQNIGRTFDWDRDESKYWSGGWLDADNGHIVMTRNTRGEEIGAESGDETAEIWVISLRWDKVLIFHNNGMGVFLRQYTGSGLIVRDASKWGGRRWLTQSNYVDGQTAVRFDHRQIPAAPNDFVGTLRNKNSEDVVPAITYGVAARTVEDKKICVGYGVQQVPASIPGDSPYYAGVIELNDGPKPDYPRWLFRKEDVAFDDWKRSDEGWVVTALSYGKALWWTQAEQGAFGELSGALCRAAWGGLIKNNDSSAFYAEDLFWSATDLIGGRGINMFLRDSSPLGDELVLVSSGWLAGSWLTALWYDSATPANSVVRTYGTTNPAQPVSDHFTRTLPVANYPAWFPNKARTPTPALNLMRFAGGAAQGVDSLFTIADGFSLAFVQFRGLGTFEQTYEIFRGKAIQRGDFVLELSGRLIPPFAAGIGLNAIDLLDSSQTWSLFLQVVGDRRLRGFVGLTLVGNQGGVGGFRVVNGFGFRSNTSTTSVGQIVTPSTANTLLGADVKFRIKRSGGVWFFYYWDVNAGAWVLLTQQTGPESPVVPSLVMTMADYGDGGVAGAGVEVDALTLAPPDDAQGQVEHRIHSYNVIPSAYGNVSAGAVFRGLPYDASAARLIVGDNWAFPGLLPHP